MRHGRTHGAGRKHTGRRRGRRRRRRLSTHGRRNGRIGGTLTWDICTRIRSAPLRGSGWGASFHTRRGSERVLGTLGRLTHTLAKLRTRRGTTRPTVLGCGSRWLTRRLRRKLSLFRKLSKSSLQVIGKVLGSLHQGFAKGFRVGRRVRTRRGLIAGAPGGVGRERSRERSSNTVCSMHDSSTTGSAGRSRERPGEGRLPRFCAWAGRLQTNGHHGTERRCNGGASGF